MSSGIHTSGLHQLPHPRPTKQMPKAANDQLSFKDVFEKELQTTKELKISKHAEKRLHKRDVDVTDTEWKKISEKVEEAKYKGVKDSIVLTDSAALVVSAENQTVITAMTREEASDHIFTNINGTIVVKE
ncbi:TIGR02530 family flagellar biosynthesis protein [Alteribacillus sp. YIM 98480]|uniref:TIGR02530 family flagellar biosynthesis protein n=1 Tax=Alteribacillus sp. YIM 98480 TaxID=2606599 RepID=UPI00131D9046|nr:TIGR02530 family flagellar biosynthesis protein [Alteribacillus sp. YIM 98480]